jgi:hypothetical protein
MNLHEIQNLSFAELKERRDELVKLAGGGDLAARYIQALTDAKMRDEKLGEQGVTINRLNDALGMSAENVAKAQELIAKTTAALEQERADRAKECGCHAETCGKMQTDINELGSKLAAETARANRLVHLSLRNEQAINGAAKLLQDAIALRMIDAVNEG